jgi:ankyrin repeat protein
VNPEDDWCQTPLSLAAGAGHEGVVQLLLKHGGAHPVNASGFDSRPVRVEEANSGNLEVRLEFPKKIKALMNPPK